MKTKLTLLIILLSLFFIYENINAQPTTYQWAKKGGGIDAEYGFGIAVDLKGNSYVTGSFTSATITFGGTVLTSPNGGGNSDTYIVKYDSSGNVLWAKVIGGVGDDCGKSIAIDSSGNVYTAGYFVDSIVDLDPGPGTYNLTNPYFGAKAIFISKLDSSGDFVWAKSINGPGNDEVSSMVLDGNGNIYTTGVFYDTVDFDPGISVYNLIAFNANQNMFICKLDSNGDFIWAKRIGDTVISSSAYPLSIAIDTVHNVYTTGSFNGTIDFDPGTGVFNLTSISTFYGDMFISKLDSNGDFIWAKSINSLGLVAGWSIAVDANQNVLTTGQFDGTVDFDPGPGGYALNGNRDIFISKLNASGNFVWAKAMTGNDWEDAFSIATDDNGNVYTAGRFVDTVDFDPGPGIYYLLPNSGSYQIFVSKLDRNGNFVWARGIGGPGLDQSSAFTLDTAKSFYITGSFEDTVDFNPPGLANLISDGNLDMFIAKYTQCKTAPSIQIVTACDNYTWIDGITYYTNNNTATYTLINATGCDSLITLDLTINHSTSGIDSVIACNTYTWIDGNTYTANNNTATYTLTNAAGCDSIVTLNLTINPLPVALFTIYPDTSLAHHWFALNQCTGAPPLTYVWNWGDSSAVSTGATPSHVYADSGYYNICVTVTDSHGCSDTYCDSSTYIYKGTNNNIINLTVVTQLPTGIAELNGIDDGVSVYPNPAKDYLTIETGSNKKYDITITDIMGKIVYASTASIGNTTVSTKDFPQGVYAVRVQGDNFIETRKVIVAR